MIKSSLKDIDIIYIYADGYVRELTQVMCNNQELWSSFKPFSKTFNYNGSTQSVTIPYTGLYKIEAHGGKGGDGSYYGTQYKGSTGTVSVLHYPLSKGDVIYVIVGGNGNTKTGSVSSISGGYNGGGSTSNSGSYANCNCGSGGGATTIGLNVAKPIPTSGLITNANLLAIASGGGGSGSKGGNGNNSINVINTQSAGQSFSGVAPTGSGGGGYRGGAYGGERNGGYRGSGYIIQSTTIYKGVTYTNSYNVGSSSTLGYATITRIA